MGTNKVSLRIAGRDSDDDWIEIRISAAVARLNRTISSEFDLEADRCLRAEGHALPAKDHTVGIRLDHVDVVCWVAVGTEVGPHPCNHRQAFEVRFTRDGEVAIYEVGVRQTEIGRNRNVQRSIRRSK